MSDYKRLVDDPEVLKRLEDDLINKCAKALNDAAYYSVVHGVFSLDDLENKTEKDLDGKLAVGVGYSGCTPTAVNVNPTQGNVANMLEYTYTIMFAVPVDALCSQRYSASKILTVLRRSILGSQVESRERTQRTWSFVRERPEIAESSGTMLYYTQVWRLLMPVTSNQGA